MLLEKDDSASILHTFFSYLPNWKFPFPLTPVISDSFSNFTIHGMGHTTVRWYLEGLLHITILKPEEWIVPISCPSTLCFINKVPICCPWIEGIRYIASKKGQFISGYLSDLTIIHDSVNSNHCTSISYEHSRSLKYKVGYTSPSQLILVQILII